MHRQPEYAKHDDRIEVITRVRWGTEEGGGGGGRGDAFSKERIGRCTVKSLRPADLSDYA